MPVRNFQPQPLPKKAQQLVDALVEEWRLNSTNADAPVIIVDDQRKRGGFTRLYVVWDDWNGLDVRERSELIMDAYESRSERCSASRKRTGIDARRGRPIEDCLPVTAFLALPLEPAGRGLPAL